MTRRALRGMRPAASWRNHAWCLPPDPLTLSALIARLEALESAAPEDRVIRPGCRVELLDLDTHERQRLRLTLPGGDDPARGRVSLFSPLGASLLGRRPGDIVPVRVFRWHSRLCITSVTPPTQQEDSTLKP